MTQRPSVGLAVERWGPFALGMTVGMASLKISWLHLFAGSWSERLLDRTIGTAAILVAFLVGIVAFLPAIDERPSIRKFKEWGYFAIFVGYLRHAIFATIGLIVLCIALTVIPEPLRNVPRFDGGASAIYWGLFSYVMTSVLRTTNLMAKMLLVR